MAAGVVRTVPLAGELISRVADRYGLAAAGVLRLWTCRNSPARHEGGGVRADAEVVLNEAGRDVLAELCGVEPAVLARALPAFTVDDPKISTGRETEWRRRGGGRGRGRRGVRLPVVHRTAHRAGTAGGAVSAAPAAGVRAARAVAAGRGRRPAAGTPRSARRGGGGGGTVPPAAAAPDSGGDEEDGTEAESAKSQRERTRRAVGDLLIRQTGLIQPPAWQGTTEHQLADIACLGLRVVRRTGDFRTVMPLAVASVPDRLNVMVRLPLSGWVTYHQAVVMLAGCNRLRTFDKPEIQESSPTAWPSPATVAISPLFVLAQNIRSDCPALTNPHLVTDRLAFHPDRPLDADQYKGLRHIRLRTNVRDESAQHFAYGNAGPQDLGARAVPGWRRIGQEPCQGDRYVQGRVKFAAAGAARGGQAK
ncbi:hypothetical protein [Streptomyces sp. NBC_01314]|uniref:hypothetical protein n=1 Tax=Streptomyces sp. NBC_01314 TaxID=2903821 RepID=UPI0030932251|nr:RNAseH domain-containing protein [Streptomyces sp. NBC_01314]